MGIREDDQVFWKRVKVAISKFSSEYHCTEVALEENSPLKEYLSTDHYNLTPVSLKLAKQIIFPHKQSTTCQHLYQIVLGRYPKLKEHVTLLNEGQVVAESERWRTIVLLAVACGMVAMHSKNS